MSTIVDVPESATTPSPSPQPSTLSRLELLLKQGRVHLQDLRTRLEETTKERDRLAALLEERDASQEKLWAEQAELQHADSERHDKELAQARAELSEAIVARDAALATRNDLESRLKSQEGLRSEVDAARERLNDQLRVSEEKRDLLDKSLSAARDEVEQLKADADRAAELAKEIFETFSK